MQKRVLAVSVSFGLVVVIGFGLWMQMQRLSTSTEQPNQIAEHDQFSVIQVGENELRVEVVETPSARARGLSYRDEIGSDGMLFLFPDQEIRRFWMRGMRFSIDIVWIAQNQVVGVTENVPPPRPGTADEALPLYTSPEPVDWVLELPAGEAAAYGIDAGENVSFVGS